MTFPDTPFIRPSSETRRSSNSPDSERIPPPEPNQRKDFRTVLGEKEERPSSDKDSYKKKKTTDTAKTKGSEESEDVEKEETRPFPPVSSLFASKHTDSEGQQFQQNEGDQPPSDDTPIEQPKYHDGVVSSDLTKSKSRSHDFSKDTPVEAQPQVKESPFAVYKQINKKDTSSHEPAWAPMAKSDGDFIAMSKDSVQRKDKKGESRFHEEHSDLGFVNPLGGAQSTVNAIIGDTSEMKTSSVSQIQEIVEQLIDKLYMVDTKGKTETIVILRHPPMFEGAQVVLTSYSSASKEFNIAFENLRPDAKLLLDNNLNTLRSALTEDGHAKAIHIMTTTTNIEHRIPGENSAQLGKDRDREQQQQQQQQQRNRDQQQKDEEKA